MGVKKDHELALSNFRKAAKTLPQAEHLLGLCYLRGIGVLPDMDVAVEHLMKAAESGIAIAAFDLGMLYSEAKLLPEMVRWLNVAVDSNLPEAIYELALCYMSGRGVTEDKTKALELLNEAATLGVSKANLSLGLTYFKGADVPQDHQKALDYLLEAAEDGEVKAQDLVSSYYLSGWAGITDEDAGLYWMKKAALQGSMHSLHNLGEVFLQGLYEEEKNLEAAFACFQLAAEQGFVASDYHLARFYLSGSIVDKDKEMADMLLKKAARGGHVLARRMLNQVDKHEEANYIRDAFVQSQDEPE